MGGSAGMTLQKEYTGIDLFRLAASVLVVAIHISPLTSYSEAADFALTRVAARTAVPFFFMTTGFFLFGKGGSGRERLKKLYKKTGSLYVAAMVLYFPVNLYTGYFRETELIGILKDIFVDGTFYHLWYLPAVLTGVWLTAWLLRVLGLQRTMVCTAALYLIGLLGDSYYGLTEQIPVLRQLYGYLFRLSDYTRNGFFFAPLFLTLGAWMRGERLCIMSRSTREKTGLVLSFTGLFAEAFLLKYADVQRHDSMYLFLVPVMYFLCALLMRVRGRRRAGYADIAMCVYVLHPLVIIMLRGVAKAIHQERLLVENSLMQFVSVTAVSFAAAALFVWGRERYLHVRKRKDEKKDGKNG